MIRSVETLLKSIRGIHEAIRSEVVATTERTSLAALSTVVAVGPALVVCPDCRGSGRGWRRGLPTR